MKGVKIDRAEGRKRRPEGLRQAVDTLRAEAGVGVVALGMRNGKVALIPGNQGPLPLKSMSGKLIQHWQAGGRLRGRAGRTWPRLAERHSCLKVPYGVSPPSRAFCYNGDTAALAGPR